MINEISSIIDIAKLLTEYEILTKYLIKKINKKEYIDREELKDLLIAFDFDIEDKEIESNE